MIFYLTLGNYKYFVIKIDFMINKYFVTTSKIRFFFFIFTNTQDFKKLQYLCKLGSISKYFFLCLVFFIIIYSFILLLVSQKIKKLSFYHFY